jgi:hypothetical protein
MDRDSLSLADLERAQPERTMALPLRRLLVDAARHNVDVTASVEPIQHLIDIGYDLEADILPVVARMVPELPRPLRSWGAQWPTQEIIAAHDRRRRMGDAVSWGADPAELLPMAKATFEAIQKRVDECSADLRAIADLPVEASGGEPTTPELSDQAKGGRAPDVGVAPDPPDPDHAPRPATVEEVLGLPSPLPRAGEAFEAASAPRPQQFA